MIVNNTNLNMEIAESNYYEVSFKCSLKIYFSHQPYDVGDMVIVSATGGSNVGFIHRKIEAMELQCLSEAAGFAIPTKKILSKLKDGDETIRNILLNKISTERQALGKCQWIMRGHRSGTTTDIFAAEFQFDNKKLSIYLKKHEEISVCRLVRKLYETFKMKIKVIECDSFEVLQDSAAKYLKISGFAVSLVDVFTPSVQNQVNGNGNGNNSHNHNHGHASNYTSTNPPRVYEGNMVRTQSMPPHFQPPKQRRPYEESRLYEGNLLRTQSMPPRHPSGPAQQHYPYHHPSLHSLHSDATLQSELAHYGPSSLSRLSSQSPQYTGFENQTNASQSQPQSQLQQQPQPKKPVLLGPLLLLSPTSIANTGRPFAYSHHDPTHATFPVDYFPPHPPHQNMTNTFYQQEDPYKNHYFQSEYHDK